MLQWLFPSSCPCDPAAKAWVEERLQWLIQEFDDHDFNLCPIIVPTAEFFPEPCNGSERTVRLLSFSPKGTLVVSQAA
jgi:hypothetical protein